MNNSLKKKFYDGSKLTMIKEMQNLLKQYHTLVDKLSSILTTEEQRNELVEEIKLLEDTLKSKMTITTLMRGF
jgi:uncharacterized protein Yka (UPF0111/DUF47 family)